MEWHQVCKEVERRGFAGEVPIEPDLDNGNTAFNEYMAILLQHRSTVEQLLRDALFAGSIKSFTLLPTGRLVELARHIWGSELFEKLAGGLAPVNDGADAVMGRVLILVDDLNRSFPPSETRPELEAPSEENFPPYLRFMLTAARQLGTNGNTRLPKQQIVSWLEEHWPKDLGPPSTGKLEFMATFLRHPEDQKGGHFRSDRKT